MTDKETTACKKAKANVKVIQIHVKNKESNVKADKFEIDKSSGLVWLWVSLGVVFILVCGGLSKRYYTKFEGKFVQT